MTTSGPDGVLYKLFKNAPYAFLLKQMNNYESKGDGGISPKGKEHSKP